MNWIKVNDHFTNIQQHPFLNSKKYVCYNSSNREKNEHIEVCIESINGLVR